MIPSHAVYLALLTGKSIYVKKELVDQQEKFGEYEEER
jgi:bifunctional DNase/RNase